MNVTFDLKFTASHLDITLGRLFFLMTAGRIADAKTGEYREIPAPVIDDCVYTIVGDLFPITHKGGSEQGGQQSDVYAYGDHSFLMDADYFSLSPEEALAIYNIILSLVEEMRRLGHFNTKYWNALFGDFQVN